MPAPPIQKLSSQAISSLRMGLVVVFAVCLAQSLAFGEEKRTYHPVTVAQLASGKVIHTHVQVTARVSLHKKEADGDWHNRLGKNPFIVAECIPEIPIGCEKIKVGDYVRVKGITRYDAKHKWFEVHPVESLEILP